VVETVAETVTETVAVTVAETVYRGRGRGIVLVIPVQALFPHHHTTTH